MDDSSDAANEVHGVGDLLLPRNLRRPRVLWDRLSAIVAVAVAVAVVVFNAVAVDAADVVVIKGAFYGAESSAVVCGLGWKWEEVDRGVRVYGQGGDNRISWSTEEDAFW